jgi:hypothetical protein
MVHRSVILAFKKTDEMYLPVMKIAILKSSRLSYEEYFRLSCKERSEHGNTFCLRHFAASCRAPGCKSYAVLEVYQFA